VWTNIIDNAIDAMGGKGELRVRTWRDDDSVVVEIADNGPGFRPRFSLTSLNLSLRLRRSAKVQDSDSTPPCGL